MQRLASRRAFAAAAACRRMATAAPAGGEQDLAVKARVQGKRVCCSNPAVCAAVSSGADTTHVHLRSRAVPRLRRVQVFVDQQRKFRALVEGSKNLSLPQAVDAAAVKKFQADYEALRKKARARDAGKLQPGRWGRCAAPNGVFN
jgi:hypothetical protein